MMKVAGSVMLLLLGAMAGLIQVWADSSPPITTAPSDSDPRIRDSNVPYCAVNAGISTHCTDIQLDDSGIMLSATCKSRFPWNNTATVTGFNIAKFIANDNGELHVHPCNLIFSWRRDCNFQDSCQNTRLVDSRFLSSYCNDGNGLYMHNIKDLDRYLGVTEDGMLAWGCFWPYE